MKKSEINPERRNFLRMLSLAGAGTVVAAAPIMFSERFSSQLYQARQTRTLMGTYVQMTVLDKSVARAEDAVNDTFVEMARLEEMLTRFSATSPLAELNASGRVSGTPAELMQVLAAAGQIYRISQGHFDVTILPLLNAVESQVKSGTRLDSQDLAQIQELVGFERLAVSGNSVSLGRVGMAVTLDGIAKGYIVDQAIIYLQARGIKNALVNAGGDLRALGGKENGQGWQILVQDPANKNAYLTRLAINDQAVATSGNYEAYFDQAKLFGHIVNPDAPLEPAAATSATVLASTCTVADAMATALFVMGAEDGLSMIKDQAQLGAFLVERSGQCHQLRFA